MVKSLKIDETGNYLPRNVVSRKNKKTGMIDKWYVYLVTISYKTKLPANVELNFQLKKI